jgi:hypothetical protein
LRSRRPSKTGFAGETPSAFHREAFADKAPLVIAIEGDPHLLNRYDVTSNPKKHLGGVAEMSCFQFPLRRLV